MHAPSVIDAEDAIVRESYDVVVSEQVNILDSISGCRVNDNNKFADIVLWHDILSIWFAKNSGHEDADNAYNRSECENDYAPQMS